MIRSLCAVALLLAVPAAVLAEEDACSAEVARLCPQSRGDLLMLGCLRANEPAFQKVCKGNLKKVLDKALSMASACDGDVKRHCKDVAPGDGRVARCLKDNEYQLSQSCQGAFNQWRVMRMEFQSACAGDIGTHCKMVPEGAGRIWTCLQKNAAALSSDCRSAVNKL